MKAQAAYDELVRRAREEAVLESAIGLLGWDEETYLPRAGADLRADQVALLTGLHHAHLTDPHLDDLLAAVEGSPLVADPDSAAAVNVRETRRAYDRLRRLPRVLVEELARTTTLAQLAWEAARRERAFAPFRPWLEKVIVLKRAQAEALGYETVAYDALLDEFEPDTASADLAERFDALRRELLPLAVAITHARRQANVAVLRQPFPLDRQRLLCEAAAAAVGFDFRRGRLDTAVHPFCTAVGPDDCRITTRYEPHNFTVAFFTVLHESGHALYEQGLEPHHYGTPMGEAPAVSVHEAQARLWENQVGRSRPFWEGFYPLARALFPDALAEVPLDAFYFAVNHVQSSFIRSVADEVTYNLHILARFDLERALIAGDLRVADLPSAWNEAYRHYLGITPADDMEGCLQDGHWASGLFGYFPTYTLGNLIAAQLFNRAHADIGDLDRAFAGGRFEGLLGWLREHVYRAGHRYSAARLIERATGSPLDHRPFVRALRRKYEELYAL